MRSPTGTPTEAQRLALRIVRSQGLRGGLAERLRRRVLVVGRAVHLGIHLVPEVVLAKMLEHGEVAMAPGTVHVIAWVDREPDGEMIDHVAEVVDMHRPASVVATFELRYARWWHRLAAAWIRWREDRPT